MNNSMPHYQPSPERIAACAKAFCHQPEVIVQELQRDFLREMLTRDAIDYDDAAFFYHCQDLTTDCSLEIDVFVRLAADISEDETLTPAEVGRLAKMIANLAVSVIMFNLYSGDAGTPEKIDAASDASQYIDTTH